jgi:Trp operon repressor
MGSVNEEWRAIAGFEGLYQVSSLGRVKSVERTVTVNGRQQKAKTIRERVLCQKINSPGRGAYLRYMVHLCKGGRQTTHNVARLVAEAFIANPTKLPCVLHKDDNALNNRVDNLEWGTLRENSRQAAERCRMCYGERHHVAKFSDVDRQIAYRLLAEGAPAREVANRFGVSYRSVADLRQGNIKGYDKLAIPKQVSRGSANPTSKLEEKDVLLIKQMLANRVRHIDIAQHFGVSQSAIAAISRGVNWGWLQIDQLSPA